MDLGQQSIICPVCSQINEITKEICGTCDSVLLLQERYRLNRILGRNTGVTYLATDVSTGTNVVIKELSLTKLSSWKEQELFQRETEVLKQLNHPGIPHFVSNFFLNEPSRQVFYFVQEHLDGQNLKTEMESHRYNELELLQRLKDIVGILKYLSDLRPPVVHRDIKPSNIICKSDGTTALIDFGAVSDLLKPGNQGATVAGTFGYMAPEQMYGQALPASDIYSLGITALVLLSRRNPEELLNEDFSLDWERYLTVSAPLKALLSCFIAKSPHNRPDAVEAERLVAETIHALEYKPPVSVMVSEKKENNEYKPVRNNYSNSAERKPVVHVNNVPAETKKAGNGKVVGAVLGLFLMFSGIGFVLIKAEEPGYKNAAVSESSVYEELPVNTQNQPVPKGIKGLSFGMTSSEVAEVLPEAAEAVPQDMEPIYDYTVFAFDSESIQPEGFELNIRTTIGNLPTDCTLTFAVNNTLSRIQCRLDPITPQGAHEKAEQAVISLFYEKYGKEDYFYENKPDFSFEMNKLDRSWTWQDSEAELEFISKYSSFMENFSMPEIGLDDTSELIITNTWSQHESQMAYWQNELDKKIEQRQRENEAAEYQRQLDLQKQMEDMNLGDDL